MREIVSLLDESISDLRAALGINSFDVVRVADPAPVILESNLGMPGVREQLDQVFRAAAMVDRPANRVALLQSAVLLIAEAGAAIPPRMRSASVSLPKPRVRRSSSSTRATQAVAASDGLGDAGGLPRERARRRTRAQPAAA